MRQVLEESDIDKENNDAHKLLWDGFAVSQTMTMMMMLGAKETSNDERISRLDMVVTKSVVNILNALDEKGFYIAKREPSLEKLL